MKKIINNHRREFLKKTIKGSALIGLSIAGISELFAGDKKSLRLSTLSANMGFEQAPLPYAFSALEDVIDAQTMEIHYSKHAAAYSKNLKEAAAAESIDSKISLEEILQNISKYSMKVRNNGGGHYNHEIFWKMMRSPKTDNMPTGTLMEAIERNFTSFTKFKETFTESAKTRFGSGWAWLYVDNYKKLKLGSTPNQDNPIMDISDIKGFPLLGIDVWEHAYYLKYQNKRADYIEKWFNLINWDYIQQRLDSIS